MLLITCALHGFAAHGIPATPRPPIRLRGGAAGAVLTNYAGEAASLFGNMGGAAAFIAGGLVPLTTFAAPQPSKDDTPLNRKLKQLHSVVSACSLLSLLTSVMYATMSTNKLRETAVAATASLKTLLVEGEYALPWIGCNAHFILGLFGFAVTVGLNVWVSFGGAVGRAVSCLVGGALLMMISVVNDAVAQKGTTGLSVGGSVVSLLARYLALLLRSVAGGSRLLVLPALGLAVTGAVLAARALLDGEAAVA